MRHQAQMSNWDLMMPGMGLTAIGVAGVTISYAGIAHTFIDGMHALTGLTMMIGLIFLSAGILDGGISTSNKAKATTLVILGIAFSFGIVAITFNSVTTLPTFAGVMLIVIIPAIVMAYMSMKIPQYAKPVGVIFVIATGAAIAAYVGFGLYGPSQYLVPAQEPVEEKKAPVPTAPVTAISILKDSSVQGNPSYDPSTVQVPAGNNIEWTNYDAVVHSVTSAADAGKTFDSGLIDAGKKYLLDTSKLMPATYDYMCIVHPWMKASFVYGGMAVPQAVTAISILKDSSVQGNPSYDPSTVQVPAGNNIEWTNYDAVVHSVTSAADAGKTFDSGLIDAGKKYLLDTSKLMPATYDYMCIVHPWMKASFELVAAAPQKADASSTPVMTEPKVAPADSTTAPEAQSPEQKTETPAQEPADTSKSAETATSAEESVIVEIPSGMAADQKCADKCYSPSIAHVSVGGTITWKNLDSAVHSATAADGKTFDTSLINEGASASATFKDSGTFDYMCIVHPWMKGQVIVG